MPTDSLALLPHRFDVKIIHLFILVALACAVLIAQIVGSPSPQDWQIFDAGHYQLCAKPIFDALATNAAGAKALAAETLRLNGPLMPILSGIGIMLIPSAPLYIDLAIEALFLCGTTCIIYLALFFLTRSTKLALIGALSSLAYLPAHTASAIFLTELPTAFLIASATALPALIVTKVRLRQKNLTLVYSSLLGLAIGLVAMIKTALVPGLTMLITMAAWQTSSNSRYCLRILSTIAIGASTLALLFGLAMLNLCGRFEPLPSRDPCMNMSIGCDLQVDAWECKPMPFITQQYGFQKPLTTLAVTIKDHPLSFAQTTARKIIREIDTPWISARRVSWWRFDLIPKVQHAIYIAIGLIGIIYTGQRIHLKRFITAKSLILVSVALMTANHLIFVPFESQPRYFFSAFPLLIIAGLYAISKIIKQGSSHKIIWVSPVIALAGLLLWSSGKDPYTDLTTTTVSEIDLTIRPRYDKVTEDYLIDTKNTRDVMLTINPAVPTEEQKTQTFSMKNLRYIENANFPYKNVVLDMIDCTSKVKGITRDDLWEWYRLPISSQLSGAVKIKFSRPIAIRLKTIDPNENYQYLPAIIYRSLSHLESSSDGLDMRPPCQVPISKSLGQTNAHNQNITRATAAIVARSNRPKGKTNQAESMSPVPIYTLSLPATCTWR